MIYLVLGIICLLLPWTKRYGLLSFIIILLYLPVGNALSLYFYQWGIFFFDFYFISLFLRLLIEQRLAGKWAMFGGVIVILWALIALIGGVQFDLYFVRDFRLLLYLGTLICLNSLHYRSGMLFSGQTLKWLAVLSGASCLFYSQIATAGLIQFDDEFYVRNYFRYIAVASYFSFGFFAFNSFLPAEVRRGTLYFISIGASLLGVVLTGSRVMVFLALMLFVIGSIKSWRGIVLAVSLLFITAAPLLFLQVGGDESLSAVSRLGKISPETLFYHFQSRFLPFLLEFENFQPLEALLGGGFGQTFEIPWFSYRESKDYMNNYVDSTYLTLYSKFGIFAILMFITYAVSYFRLIYPNGRGSPFFLLIGLSVLWIVYSVPYQMTSIGLALQLFLIGSTNRGQDRGNRTPYGSTVP